LLSFKVKEKEKNEQNKQSYGRCTLMGKTVESYRMALEDEIRRWNGFANALRKEDKEAFDTLMDACRNYASAGSNATQPILFEPMIISILVSQQKKITQLEKALDANKQQPQN
jgi:hypothetical protein